MTAENLAAIKLRALLINLGTTDTRWQAAGMGPSGSNLASRLTDADYVKTAPADHHTFLVECTPKAPDLLIKEGEDPICTDPAGADRADVNARIIAQTTAFLLP